MTVHAELAARMRSKPRRWLKVGSYSQRSAYVMRTYINNTTGFKRAAPHPYADGPFEAQIRKADTPRPELWARFVG